jgi:ribonucleotide reductase beta subunit family protein with ferritin-like domain
MSRPTKDILYYVNKIANLQRLNETTLDTNKRFALFPILDQSGYEFYQKQETTHWTATELDFTADLAHYDSGSIQVKRIIDFILAFFLSGDGAISDNIVFRFLLECRTYEEKAMFISQLHIELVHAETYGLAAYTFKHGDDAALGELIETAQNTVHIKRKIEFMDKWMLSDRPRYQRLFAFACAEGIFFCTLFAIIFWFRSKGQFPNFVFANELIANDESLHRNYGAYLTVKEISLLLESVPETERSTMLTEIRATLLTIAKEAVDIEDGFVNFVIDEPLEDLNAKDLTTYARVISDNLLRETSCPTFYKVKNPFTWMGDISMEQKSNFYEVKVGAYKKRSLADVLNWKKRAGLEKNTVNVYDNPENIDF